MTSSNWPEPMAEYAFTGLAGDFVRLVTPESEADPHALLLALLVGFGAMVGRKPHYLVESTNQAVNEYVVIVGETAKGRKGTAVDRALHVLAQVEPDFIESRLRYGLSTGEGLIYAIRDPRIIGNKLDPGEQDKRLLFIEPEFSSVLRAIRMNRLSEDLRNAWDGKPISRVIKSGSYGCQKPHICLVANTTLDELKGLFKMNEKANGFGNRFLWVCARRSKLLPEGGKPLDEQKLGALVAGLRAALAIAKDIDQVTFDEKTRRVWIEKTYPRLSVGAPGLIGAMIGRSETHVLRLATLYALLDSSSVIRVEHLKAALDVWEYCEASVACVFGDVVGNETVDRILTILRASPEGLTQTQINRCAFGSNKPAEEMRQALLLLEQHKMVRSQTIKTEGRPATRWHVKT